MRKSERRKNASDAQTMLVERILSKPTEWPESIVESSSKLLWNISRRHRQPMPYEIKHWICRGCKKLLRPGVNARVRFGDKVRKITCLDCGKIRRFVCEKNGVEK